MATANLSHILTVEQYLNTTYRPDVDYVDGEIEERNLGEFDHGDLQAALAVLLRNRQQEWFIRAVGPVRIHVAPTRFRVPDVCVTSALLPREQIVRTPPLLCIEILSPRDTLKAMRKRVQAFLDMGVPTVWILDPETRTAHTVTAASMTEQTTGTLRAEGTLIELSISEIFATLDV